MKKIVLSGLALILVICSLFASALAEPVTLTQDGLEVSLTTGSEVFVANEIIPATLTVKNTNDFAVGNLSVSWKCPEGYVLETESTLSGKRLGAGETLTVSVNLIAERLVVPETGDNSHIAGWLAAFCAACVGILLLNSRGAGRRFTSLMLALAMLGSAFAFMPATAEAQVAVRSLDIQKQIKIDGSEASVGATLRYEMDQPYTRAQWVALLVDRFGYEGVQSDEPSFTDIAGTAYEAKIEAAAERNLLPVTGGAFNPNGIATREFAAATAVLFLGFAPTEDLKCADAAQLTQSKAANTAVAVGLMPLVGQYFYPQRALSQSEAETILSVISEVLSSTEHTGFGGEGYTFAEGVVELPAGISHTDSNGRLTIASTEATRALKPGDIFVIGNEAAYKVTSVSKQGSDLVINYTKPELIEFIDAMDFYGYGYMDFGQFVPAEGVTVTYNSGLNARGGDSLNIPDAKIELKGDVDLGGNWAFDYGLEFEATKLYYCFDIETHLFKGWFTDEKVLDFKNVYLKLDIEGNVHAGIKRTFGENGKLFKSDPLFREIKLGTVPIFGADGFGALIEVYIIAELDGSFTLQFDWAGQIGTQVLNNQVRKIEDLDTGISATLAGEFKVGPDLFAVAEVFDEKLISFGVNAGGKAKGEIAWRMDGDLVCIDGKAGVYGELTALERTLIEEYLDLSASWEFLDKDDILKGHWENLVKVDECTYNKAVIKGTVAEATNRTNFIKDASVRVYDTHNSLVAQEKSDAQGKYTVSVPSGKKVLKVSKSGYIPFEVQLDLETEEEIFVETLLMVEGDEDTNEQGTISGRITDAVTGSALSGVKLTIRKNWNVTSGGSVITVTTDSSGAFSATLPLGNYTIQMQKDQYVTSHFNVAVTKGSSGNKHGTLVPVPQDDEETNTPADGLLRAVLTWGATPEDLDSHMRGPTVDGNGQFHVYYADMSYYANGANQTTLDVDDVTSYGPETVTVYNLKDGGNFSYYVHDFTNRADFNSTAMSNSGAQVKVYLGDELLATYNIPTSQVGTVWHVFDYNANTNTLRRINTFSSDSDAGNVGSQLRTRTNIISPDKK